MPHYTQYKCAEPPLGCGRETLRDLLTVMKVVFTEMGQGGKILRSRTVGWLCDECVEKNDYWNLQAFTSAPGMKSEPLERVRAAQRKHDETQA